MMILQHAEDWFTLPYTTADTSQYRIAQVLYRVALIFLPISIVQGVLICLFLPPDWLPVAIPGTLLAWVGFAGIIRLVRQRQLSLASYLLTSGLWLGYTGIGFITINGELYAGMGYSFVVALSGILLQRQRLFVFCGLSIVSIVLLHTLSEIGWLTPLITSHVLDVPFLMNNLLIITALIYIFMEHLTAAQQARTSSSAALREQTQARKTAERYLKTIVDRLPMVLFSIDEDGRVRLAEGAGLAALGESAESLIGRNALEMLADEPYIQANIREALAGNITQYQYQFRGRYLDTYYLPVEEAGKRRIYGVSVDVTDRHIIEAEYLQSEQRFWNLAKTLPDTIIIAWADSGDITFINRPTFLGYDVKGRNLRDWLEAISDPEYLDVIALQWNSHTQPDQMHLPDTYLRVQSDDGTWEWLRSRVNVLDETRDGTPETLLFTFSVITQQQEAAERLRTSEQQLSVIFDESLDVILIVDIEDRIQRVNYAVYDVLGYDPAALVGESLDTLLPPGRLDDAEDDYDSQLGLTFESVPFRHADGSLVKMEMVATAVPWEEGAAILLTLRDVTQREVMRRELAVSQQRQAEIERQRDLMQAREDLIYVIAHQVRAPLTTIKLAAESIERYHERFTPERLLKQADKITKQVTYLDNMVGAMLNARNVILDKLEYAPRPHALGALCRRLTEQARNNHPTHTFLYHDDTHTAPVLIDKTLVTWIVENLLENAVKYSPEGSTVHMSLTEADEVFMVRVRDEGIGIAADDFDSIFEMFQRGSNVDEVRGTGIGLGLAYNAAITHGGDLTCESELGVGSTFTLTLPVVPAPETRH